MTYLERAQDIYQKMGEGDLQGAIDQHYADNVTVVEATGERFDGKETAKKRAAEWQQNLEAFHGGGVHNVTSNESDGVTVVESWVDITPKGGDRMKFEEVAVQKWEGDRIVRERFYYFIPGGSQEG
jgi:ketosteroid isomerase-like protein